MYGHRYRLFGVASLFAWALTGCAASVSSHLSAPAPAHVVQVCEKFNGHERCQYADLKDVLP